MPLFLLSTCIEHQDANIVVSDIVIGDLDVNCSKVRKQHDAAATTSYTDRSNKNGTLTNKSYWNEGTLNGDKIH